MDPKERRSRMPPVPGYEWDWDSEIMAAIAMVVRNRDCRIVLCAGAATGRVIARLAAAAASAGVVLEPRIRRGGGWDVEVRAA
jgi:hypothetical protein